MKRILAVAAVLAALSGVIGSASADLAIDRNEWSGGKYYRTLTGIELATSYGYQDGPGAVNGSVQE